VAVPTFRGVRPLSLAGSCLVAATVQMNTDIAAQSGAEGSRLPAARLCLAGEQVSNARQAKDSNRPPAQVIVDPMDTQPLRTRPHSLTTSQIQAELCELNALNDCGPSTQELLAEELRESGGYLAPAACERTAFLPQVHASGSPEDNGFAAIRIQAAFRGWRGRSTLLWSMASEVRRLREQVIDYDLRIVPGLVAAGITKLAALRCQLAQVRRERDTLQEKLGGQVQDALAKADREKQDRDFIRGRLLESQAECAELRAQLAAIATGRKGGG